MAATGLEAKACTKCGETKALDEFHRDRSRRDGRFPQCRLCATAGKRAEARANPEKNRERVRRWQRENPEKFKARLAREPDKQRARKAVRNAVARGVLLKPERCEDCEGQFEKRRLHGHHEDYSKQLDVAWLCASCHVRRHRAE